MKKLLICFAGWIYCLIALFITSIAIISVPFLIPVEYHSKIVGLGGPIGFTILFSLLSLLCSLPLRFFSKKIQNRYFVKGCVFMMVLACFYTMWKQWETFFGFYGYHVYGNIWGIDTPMVVWELSILLCFSMAILKIYDYNESK